MAVRFDVKYLLDTHVLIWALQDSSNLSPSARGLLSAPILGECALSDISFLEIAMLEKKGRIRLEDPVEAVLTRAARHLSILPIDPFIANDAMSLELPQGDPFDRIIVATARRHRIPLLTRDREISESGLVEIFW